MLEGITCHLVDTVTCISGLRVLLAWVQCRLLAGCAKTKLHVAMGCFTSCPEDSFDMGLE